MYISYPIYSEYGLGCSDQEFATNDAIVSFAKTKYNASLSDALISISTQQMNFNWSADISWLACIFTIYTPGSSTLSYSTTYTHHHFWHKGQNYFNFPRNENPFTSLVYRVCSVMETRIRFICQSEPLDFKINYNCGLSGYICFLFHSIRITWYRTRPILVGWFIKGNNHGT